MFLCLYPMSQLKSLRKNNIILYDFLDDVDTLSEVVITRQPLESLLSNSKIRNFQFVLYAIETVLSTLELVITSTKTYYENVEVDISVGSPVSHVCVQENISTRAEKRKKKMLNQQTFHTLKCQCLKFSTL